MSHRAPGAHFFREHITIEKEGIWATEMNTDAFTIPISALAVLKGTPHRLPSSQGKESSEQGRKRGPDSWERSHGRLSPHSGRRSFSGWSSGTCPSQGPRGTLCTHRTLCEPGAASLLKQLLQHLQTTDTLCIHSSEVRRTVLHAACPPHAWFLCWHYKIYLINVWIGYSFIRFKGES